MTNSSAAIARLVHDYRGIEEFYILNRFGDLGYIQSGNLRLIKETFQELREEEFLTRHPELAAEVRGFLQAFTQIREMLPPSPSMELGYLLPVDERRKWKTATLVLHPQVISTMGRALQFKTRGHENPPGGKRTESMHNSYQSEVCTRASMNFSILRVRSAITLIFQRCTTKTGANRGMAGERHRASGWST